MQHISDIFSKSLMIFQVAFWDMFGEHLKVLRNKTKATIILKNAFLLQKFVCSWGPTRISPNGPKLRNACA